MKSSESTTEESKLLTPEEFEQLSQNGQGENSGAEPEREQCLTSLLRPASRGAPETPGMQCRRCRHENPPQAKSCLECGTRGGAAPAGHPGPGHGAGRAGRPHRPVARG